MTIPMHFEDELPDVIARDEAALAVMVWRPKLEWVRANPRYTQQMIQECA